MRQPQGWEGDFDDLPQIEENLVDDGSLCDEVFASKHEAFLAGRFLGRPPHDSEAPNGADWVAPEEG